MIVSPTSRVIAHPFGCKQGNGRHGPAKNVPFFRFWAKKGDYGGFASKVTVRRLHMFYNICKTEGWKYRKCKRFAVFRLISQKFFSFYLLTTRFFIASLRFRCITYRNPSWHARVPPLQTSRNGTRRLSPGIWPLFLSLEFLIVWQKHLAFAFIFSRFLT